MTPTKKPIVSIAMPSDLLEKIEDFRYGRRIPSRSQAIIFLLKWALEHPPRKDDRRKP